MSGIRLKWIPFEWRSYTPPHVTVRAVSTGEKETEFSDENERVAEIRATWATQQLWSSKCGAREDTHDSLENIQRIDGEAYTWHLGKKHVNSYK